MTLRIANLLLGIVALAAVLAWGLAVQAKDGPEGGGKARVLFQGGEAVVALYDNLLADEFLRLLPLEVEFSDFAGAEKIFYLPEKFSLRNGVNADEQNGDFCYYAPWGNIAVFYKGYGHGKNLYVLGVIESGKEKLAAMKENFKARIEALAAGDDYD